MSFIKSLRTSIANLIAPAGSRSIHMVVDNAKSLTHPNMPLHLSQQVAHQEEPIKGYIGTEDVSDFASEYTRNAIGQLGAWAALAKGYNEFVKNPKSEVVGKFLSEFHAWNAVCPKQMGDDEVLSTVARLTEVKPSKSNADTDRILARVRKVSVEEIAAKRIANAAKKTAAREECLEAFVAAVWTHVFSDEYFQMPASKVEGKIIQTLEWVASWDSSNPAAQAAELLIIESDLHLARKIAKQDRENDSDFQEGVLTADGMMRLTERQA